jgi:hypothetical protein
MAISLRVFIGAALLLPGSIGLWTWIEVLQLEHWGWALFDHFVVLPLSVLSLACAVFLVVPVRPLARFVAVVLPIGQLAVWILVGGFILIALGIPIGLLVYLVLMHAQG